MSELSQVTVDQILFFLFVRLVDQEKAIGLRDVERLDRLLAKPKLLESPSLESAIQDLAKSYQQYWRLYQEKKLAQNNDELQELLNSLYSSSSQLSWAELKQGLQAFIRFFSISQGLVAKLRSQKNQHQHRLAIAANLSELLNSWQPNTDSGSHIKAYAASSTELIRQYQEQMHRLMTTAQQSDQQLAISSKGAHRLVCTHVREENALVKTYTFVKEDLTAWAYMPGQFMTFEIPMSDGILRRSYSISSSPYQPYAIDVTVKHLPQGKGSSWFHQQMLAGCAITAHGPHGNFSILHSIVDQTKPKIALFAAGVGITPLMSMLQYLLQSKQECDVVLINRVHSYQDLIFTQQLSALHSASNQEIRQITISSDSSGEWTSSLGLRRDEATKTLSPDAIQNLIPDIQERDVYLCGPDSFKDSVLASLSFMNFDIQRFYSESFGGINQQGSALLQGDHAKQIGSMVSNYLKHLNQDIAAEDECFVEFKKSGKTVRCAKGDLLLDVAEFNGISIANSCRSGACGTCKCHLVEGSVSMDSEDGLSLAELAEGNILTCVGHVNANKVVVDA
jgi:ferredoxin-NADP reductase